MEAALRTVYDYVTGGKLKNVEFENVRGLTGVKEGTVAVGDYNVRVAVAHGLSNVEYVMGRVRKAKAAGEEPPYHFIEVMACPGGCVGGGGQPYGSVIADRARRGQGLYREDKGMAKRQSHENPGVALIYEKFLDHPGSEKSHQLLHTCYFERSLLNGTCVKEATQKHAAHHG
jgi:NADH-quinone oxidoreductase subunit G